MNNIIVVGKKKEEHWEIDNNTIKVYSKPNILFGKTKLKHEIPLDDIENIDIFFTSKPLAPASRYGVFSHGHEIIFNIKINNKENVLYNILTTTDRETLIQAIDYLICHDIKITDQYNLIDLIKEKEKKIWDGIEDIIKKNKLPYSIHKV